MIVREIVQALDLKVIAGSVELNREITGGYCADLLSCVMARAKANVIIDGRPEEDDAILQESRIDIERPFTAAVLFNHHGYQVHFSPSGIPFFSVMTVVTFALASRNA